MIFNRITLSISFIFIVILTAHAQNKDSVVKWLVEYSNGTVVDAKVKPFLSSNNVVKFKNLSTNKREKAKAKDLKSITKITQTDTLIYRKMPMQSYRAFWKAKDIGYLVWVAKVYETDKMEGYVYWAYDFYYTATGSVTGTADAVVDAQAIRVIPEDYVFSIHKEIIAMNGKKTAQSLMNQTLKKYLANYCPAFAEKIKKRTYEASEMVKIIDDYTAQCK